MDPLASTELLRPEGSCPRTTILQIDAVSREKTIVVFSFPDQLIRFS
jgi:hypothetical protein